MTDNPRQTTPGPGGTYVLCAGGTGGHMVPAHCLALELMARGHKVHLVTDERGLRFPGLFPGVPVTKVEAASTGRSGWRSLPQVALSIWKGRSAARKLFKEMHPRAVIGFGGYPALPGLLAGLSLYLPCLIHEQNAVLGRTNRYLAPRVRAIATSFPRVRRMEGSWQRRAHFVGNPVRPEVLAARDVKFDENAARLKLLVTGGSQGAAVLNRVVPDAVRLLPAAVRVNLDITHQGRDEDRDAMLAAYRAAGIEATIAAYFPDLPAEMASSHIVIARSGASTVAELAVMGRPSILVPLPIATDAEDGAGRDLAVIKRKTGDEIVTGLACVGKERAEPHRYSLASTAAGSRPVRSRSRLGSGTTPSGGAMRRMMLLMAGATTMPAVRKP
jgi:UDP-N-acetylglucosamine--N-acetylmuramyl-(pentapeptide) pyrophosphoryl-undecaprenol N-acetylglucosamine transferase